MTTEKPQFGDIEVGGEGLPPSVGVIGSGSYDCGGENGNGGGGEGVGELKDLLNVTF